MNVYRQGRIVVADVVFRDGETGNAVDPTTVTFYYELADGTQGATLTYAGATQPAVGTIARLGIGRYRTWIDTASFLGRTKEVWLSSGADQTVGCRVFQVIPV